MARNVTVSESVHIRATPQAVWDYTQDWSRRSEWDPAILGAEELPGKDRVVRAQTRGGELMVRYKLVDAPRKTSLAMTASSSRIVTGGGGSWEYAAEDGGTRFTQRNTLSIKNRFFAWLFAWALGWQLRRLTRKALANAKRILESSVAS